MDALADKNDDIRQGTTNGYSFSSSQFFSNINGKHTASMSRYENKNGKINEAKMEQYDDGKNSIVKQQLNGKNKYLSNNNEIDKEEYESYVSKRLDLITKTDYDINKKIIPDLGDFFMLIFLSNKDMSSSEMKKVKKALIEEFFTRQLFWMFHSPECAFTMKSKLLNCYPTLSNKIYLERYSSDEFFEMKFPNLFIKELHNQNVYDEIISIFSNDNCILWNCNDNYKFAKQMVEDEITKSFKNLYST